MRPWGPLQWLAPKGIKGLEVAFGLQAAARRAHQRLAAEENQQLMMAKAQHNYEEEQYDKDVTRHDQQTEVSLG